MPMNAAYFTCEGNMTPASERIPSPSGSYAVVDGISALAE